MGGRAPRYLLSPDHFQKVKRMLAPDWAQKMLCIIVPNRRTVSPEFFSWVRTRRLLSRKSCLVRSPSFPNQKQRNYWWVEERFGCYQREQFNLHWESSVSDGSQCERFEPKSHFKSRLSLIVRVNVVLMNRTVVVDSDWRFDNLCGSHLQSQSELYHVSWWYYSNQTNQTRVRFCRPRASFDFVKKKAFLDKAWSAWYYKIINITVTWQD